MPWLPDWAVWLLVLVGALVLFLAFMVEAPRLFWKVVLWPRYRIVASGRENIPMSDPVLLASNHMTWFDGFFVVVACPRGLKALTNADYINWPIGRWMARRAGLIPVPASGPKAQRQAITLARQALDAGEALLIFPEAQLSRNGLTGPFHRGVEAIHSGRDDVPVIPVYLDNLWGSLVSFSGGRFVWKRPRGWRRTVVVRFGPPVPPPITAFSIRQGVIEAGVQARATIPPQRRPALPEPIDLSLPHLEHPALGLLAVSSANFDRGGIRQTGWKEGSVGQAAPGVALMVVDENGEALPPDATGRLMALLPDGEDWRETGHMARIDRDGFVMIEEHTA